MYRVVAFTVMSLCLGCTSSPPAVANGENEKPARSSVAQVTDSEQSNQFAAAEDFAALLQHNYEENGYDISVRANHQHELILESDLFKDADQREAVVEELVKSKTDLCQKDIWSVHVGYSKGLLSGNVQESVSLGCLAEIQETQPARDAFAKEMNQDGQGVIRIHAERTVLVSESEAFDNPANRQKWLSMIFQNSRKVCDLGFSTVKLKGTKQVKTAPIPCS